MAGKKKSDKAEPKATKTTLAPAASKATKPKGRKPS